MDSEVVAISAPTSHEAESAVLAALLFGDAPWAETSALNSGDFIDPERAAIFRACEALYEAGAAVDALTVLDKIRDLAGDEKRAEAAEAALEGLRLAERPENVGEYVSLLREKTRRRSLMLAGRKLAGRAQDGDTDSSALASQAITDILASIDADKQDTELAAETIKKFPGGIELFLDQSKAPTGKPTGFYDLDEIVGGMRRSELTILGARPRVGKTALALSIAANMLSAGATVLLYSLEMSRISILHRALCALAEIEFNSFRHGRVSPEERTALRSALHALVGWQFYINDSSALEIGDLVSDARRFKMKQPLDLLIVDYLQLMSSSRRRNENRVQEVTAISRGLKAIARDCDIPVLALSQLSRAVDSRRGGDRKPRLSDLRESGSLEQDADVVWLLHRDELTSDKPESRGLAELNVAKQRNGPSGEVTLQWVAEYMQFRNSAQAWVGDA